MQRIIIDTNIFVSSLIQRSSPFFIVNDVFGNQKIELCISEELLKEYMDVLNREKFARFVDFQSNAKSLLIDIESFGRLYNPEKNLDIISDEKDNRLLELAVAAKADYLITGNHNDFTMDDFRGTKIITARDYWKIMMKEKFS